MKTGQHYFNLLSAKEQVQFKNNYSKYRLQLRTCYSTFLNQLFENFNCFINASFIWRKTPQKFTYWKKIANRQVE